MRRKSEQYAERKKSKRDEYILFPLSARPGKQALNSPVKLYFEQNKKLESSSWLKKINRAYNIENSAPEIDLEL